MPRSKPAGTKPVLVQASMPEPVDAPSRFGEEPSGMAAEKTAATKYPSALHGLNLSSGSYGFTTVKAIEPTGHIERGATPPQ